MVEGGGPKYDRSKVVPTDGGAGNKLQPGPGPMGPGPGPWAALESADAAGSTMSAVLNRCSIAPWNARRGVRRRDDSWVKAVNPDVSATAEATVHEISWILMLLKRN